MTQPTFHLAIPVHDFATAKQFYIKDLGFKLGRVSKHAMVIDFGNHQIVAHLVEQPSATPTEIYPRHFGLIFHSEPEWQALLERARKNELKFFREPVTRFADQRTEHKSFFLLDPSNNLLEFKYYAQVSAILGETTYTEVGETPK